MMTAWIRHFEISPQTVFMTDLDGTVLKLLSDPAKRQIDKDARIAFDKFGKRFPGQVIPITGRDYEQVVQCMGGVPTFPVISSNGAELQMPDGRLFTYPFAPEEKTFMTFARQTLSAFAKRHPWLVVEVKRWEVGYHSSMSQGYEEPGVSVTTILDRVRESAEAAREILFDLGKRAKNMNLDFSIASAEQTHHALTHSKVDKLGAIGWFADKLKTLPCGSDWGHVVYCGDSLLNGENGSAPGNDRQIAQEVRKNGGVVIQVVNHASIPDENDQAEPHLAVRTPNELGNLLRRRVEAFLSTYKS